MNNDNKQVAKQEEKMMTAFELDAIKHQLSSLLENNPKKIESFKTRMLKIALGYGLNECTPESIINCGLQALTLDLPLEAGQGYIVAYKKKATFDCGYKGWQVLAKRAGFSVLSDVVYSCDDFYQNGFGFDRDIVFTPDFSQRKSANDKWAKENLTGVIVSIMEDETKNKTHAFVDADMINKIVGVSPSKGSDFSPHNKWSEQMFQAKAIKQVLSKFPIDLSKSSQLNDAIQIVNSTEIQAQNEDNELQKEYPQDKFDDNYPKWVDRVKTGTNSAMLIITKLSNTFNLTEIQMEKLMDLKNHEPIEAEYEEKELKNA